MYTFICTMKPKTLESITSIPDEDSSIQERIDRMVSLLCRIPHMHVEWDAFLKRLKFTYMDYWKNVFVGGEDQCLHYLEWLGKGRGGTVYLVKDGRHGFEGFHYRFPQYGSADQLEMTCLVKGW